MAEKPSIFVRILLPFGCGILVSSTAGFAKLNLLLQISILSLFILLFIINYLYTSLKVYHHKEFLAALIYLFFFLTGILCFQHQNEENSRDHFSRNNAKYISITIADEPQQKGGMLRFKARVTHAFWNGKTRATSGTLLVVLQATPPQSSSITYGNTYLIPANYQPVPPPYNPGEFDFSAWLANQNIRQQVFLSAAEMVLLGTEKGNLFINFTLRLRRRETALFRRLIKDNEAYAVAATLILGYRSDLSAETLNAYAKTGTIHALSVSGMHVGIIYLVLEFSLRWMNKNRALRWLKMFLIIALIWGYTLLSGYAPSILRSAIMLSLFLLAKGLKKNADSFHILSFSAFILLLYNPFFLTDLGFLLSYLAVFGLVYLQPKIEGIYTFKNRWLQKIWGLICLSVSAQALTFPLSIYAFHQFPVHFVLSNLFITLPVAVLMYLGIAILLLPLDGLAPVFEGLILFMNRGLEMISRLPYPVVMGIWIDKMELILLCLSLSFLFKALWAKNKYQLLMGFFCLTILQFLLVKDKIVALKQRKVVLFSLQKNYAVAFIRGKKATFVTDLQPGAATFKFHIQPALDQLKVNELRCVSWNTAINSAALQLRDHQLRFGKLRVLLIDSTFNYKRVLGHRAYDAIWLHAQPRVQMEQLRQDITFNKIWIDSSNPPYAINQYQRDTINFKGSTVVLKKIRAYLIDLK
jgi:competence protein ComEC